MRIITAATTVETAITAVAAVKISIAVKYHRAVVVTLLLHLPTKARLQHSCRVHCTAVVKTQVSL
jgi:hypothetical protein